MRRRHYPAPPPSLVLLVQLAAENERLRVVEEITMPTPDLEAENNRLKEALLDIFHASRDDGLSSMVIYMRNRAFDALTEGT